MMLSISHLHVAIDDKPIHPELSSNVLAGEASAVVGPDGTWTSVLWYTHSGGSNVPRA